MTERASGISLSIILPRHGAKFRLTTWVRCTRRECNRTKRGGHNATYFSTQSHRTRNRRSYRSVHYWSFDCLCRRRAPGAVDSIDQLYEKVRKEGGKLTVYAALSARSMEVILPAFLKRFPGVTLDRIDVR